MKTTSNQEPIQPDFYLPNEKGSRLSEVHQMKTGEKSPKENYAVLLVLENLRSKYGTKFFLLDQYSGHLYIVGNETIGPDPIEEKGWIYPTESSLPVTGALSEFQQTPYRSMQVSNIKETPDAESTQVPITISTAKMEGRPTLGNVDERPLEVDPTQEKEEVQWEFIWDEVKRMKEAWENAQKEQQRLRKEQVMIEEQWAMIEAEGKQKLQEQWEKTQDSILRAKKGLANLQNKTALVMGLPSQISGQEEELKALVALDDSPKKKNKDISGITETTPVRLTSYPSSESLQDFDFEGIDTEHYWYYAIKAERIKKKMDQAAKAFSERVKSCQDLAQYDQTHAEYEQHNKKLHCQLITIKDMPSKQKQSEGLYEYPSASSLVSHLGEGLNSKPRTYFERTKREVLHQNTLVKKGYQHKMENITTDEEKRKTNHEYARFKKRQAWILLICDKRIRGMEGGFCNARRFYVLLTS